MVHEEVQWYDWTEVPLDMHGGGRVYVGDAMCEKRLPAIDFAVETARRLKQQAVDLTLVTPFVSEAGLKHTMDLIEALCDPVSGPTFNPVSGPTLNPLEVVCNDWGVLDMVAELPGCLPIAGRQLVGQDTDPRWYGMMDTEFQQLFEREVQHVDDTIARLCRQPPPLPLVRHVQRCSLDQPFSLQYLSQRGVNRLELNNLLQGLDFSAPPGWHVSLHVPDVLVTIARDCANKPGAPCGENPCPEGCCAAVEKWTHPSFPVSLYSRANGVYYLNPSIPRNIGIDRIVWRKI